ncbi:hypothetical protein ES703_37523 [subsurface metagenome]
MRIDLITKVTLIMIAVCLAALTVKSFLPGPAIAAREGIIKVDVVSIGGVAIWRVVDVNVREVGGSPISKGELLGKK